MKELVSLLAKEELVQADSQKLEERKRDADAKGMRLIGDSACGIYPKSLYRTDDVLYCMGRTGDAKVLVALTAGAGDLPFDATVQEVGGYRAQFVQPNAKAAPVLHELFPFTRPKSLRDDRTTVGMGDRLGIASAGHIRAARKYAVSPVLAQQSVRELEFTDRSFADVVADASFLVFQEGFESGYGADGDHLKTIDAIDTALAQHMPMITLDLTEVLKPDAAKWSGEKLDTAYAELPADFRARVESDYAGKSFNLGGDVAVSIDEQEAKRCAVMYGEALSYAQEVDAHLKRKTNDNYDLEVSIDETTSPTLPEHHLFIARELDLRGVTVNSVAPRFIGDFQKAIDYIGDTKEFEKQFAVHCEIARAFGTYKISVHSGSDKFSVYPAIGRHTQGRFHLKTSGTSWLESIRVIAARRPALYRTLHKKAFDYFPEAVKKYHITADIDAIPALDSLSDDQLPSFLDDPNCRQLLHISYGGLLTDPDLHEPFFRALYEEEEAYNDAIQAHFEKHLGLLFQNFSGA